jgi:cobalt/nickel transport system permease protein
MEKWIVLSAMFLLTILVFVVKRRNGRRHGERAHEHRHSFGHKHGGLISIDYLAYSSKIRHWNPTFKVILSVLTIILCIALNNVYVSIVVILAMAYLVIKVGGLALHDYLSVLAIPLAFILISIFAIVIDFSDQPIGIYHLYLGFGYLYTTMAMLKYGVFLMLKVIAAISGLQLMILTTPSSEVISVMKKAHVPKDFIALMNMIYRYIFILLDVFAKMKNSAESRLGYRDFKTSCYTFGGVASNMLVLSLKKAGAYYDAMEARCYDGELMFLEEDKKVEIRLIVPAAVYVLCLLLLWYLTR